MSALESIEAALPAAHASHALAFGLALAASALLTSIVKRVAVRFDFVSRPRNDRWARTVIPLGGGIAIFLALGAGILLAVDRMPYQDGIFHDAEALDLVLALTAIFVLGLVDDRRRLSPQAKLVVQTVAAAYLTFRGVTLPFSRSHHFQAPIFKLLEAPVTVAWFVFMANSVNLLDNMDGSAAGVSGVSALFVYIIAASGNQPGVAASAAVLVGAACGFLIHNFPPATIFMGDAGSLVLGFALAGLSVRLPRGSGLTFLGTLLAPAIVLAIPIFDTALVWAARRAAGRPFFLGGRDHTAHRLVALGLSERRTVLVLYAAAGLLGAAALSVAHGGLGTVVLTGLLTAVVMLLCGVFLLNVRVYKASGPAQPRSSAPAIPVRALYAVEIAVDVAIVSAAWVAAYVVKFADSASLEDYLRGSCLEALPFVIGLKIAALLSQGLYRGFSRAIRFADVFRILRAGVLGTVLVVTAAAIANRLTNYSREVFVIDAVFFMGGIFLSRAAVRALRSSVARLAQEPRRAILLGPRSLLPLVRRGLERDGSPPVSLLGVLDPDVPAGDAAATPPLLAGKVEDAAAVAEGSGATVILVALPEDELRARVVRDLASRGIDALSVGVTVE